MVHVTLSWIPKKPTKLLCLVSKTNVQTLALRSTLISAYHTVRKCPTEPLLNFNRALLRISHLLHPSCTWKKINSLTYEWLWEWLWDKRFLDTLEIGSLGHFKNEAVTTLHATLPSLTRTISCLLLELTKIAVYCSSHIFNARSTDWNSNTSFVWTCLP